MCPTPLVLDFARGPDGHLVYPASALHTGENRIVIDFDAGDVALNRNDEYLYTIFVPARAHEAFPCFDQPDLKARWTLSLEVPEGWEALPTAPTSKTSRDGRTRVAFAETQPLPTYLFAFAAGKFSVERAERNGRAMRMFHRETDAAKVARNRDAIFDLHAAALAWDGTLHRDSLSVRQVRLPARPGVSVRRHGARGRESSITRARCCSIRRRRRTNLLDRASVVSHETAHMWFGDLVTMRWFNDVWMKEVFANFMAARIVNPSFPGVNHDLRFLLNYYPAGVRHRPHRRIERHPPAAREPERSRHALPATSSTTRRRSSCASSRHSPARTRFATACAST